MRSPRPAKAICGVAGDVVGKTRAACALDATFAIEQDQRANLDGLDEMALLFDEAGLA
jgi:hypothetical protein